jgi:ATP-dependent Zn protease
LTVEPTQGAAHVERRRNTRLMALGRSIAPNGGFLMNEWLSLLVSWLPFLLLIGVWLWFSRTAGMKARGRSGVTMIELYEQQVEETRRMNATLERIAAAMERRRGA